MQNASGPLLGNWLPLVTSFKCGGGCWIGHLFNALAAHYLTQRIDGVVLAATTGKGMAPDPSEVSSMVDIVSEVFDGASPIYLGVSGNDS